jgi:hypothetical protein
MFEMPRMEVFDPVGLDYMLRVFRVERLLLHELIRLHLIIAGELLERKMFPHVGTRDAIAAAVETRTSVDVNLKLFDYLGRIAMTGLWFHWFAHFRNSTPDDNTYGKLAEWSSRGFELIQRNPTLLSPLCDQHAIEIALFSMFAATIRNTQGQLSGWLHEVVNRMDFTVRTHGKYPCIFTDYRDLIEHPRHRTDEYRKDAMSGSILIPLLAGWLSALNDQDALKTLIALKESELQDCTLQLWLPDKDSEDGIYIGLHDHGVALMDLQLSPSGTEILDTIAQACQREKGFANLSANKTGYWPIILLACRHYRYPIPPQFWIDVLHPTREDQTS